MYQLVIYLCYEDDIVMLTRVYLSDIIPGYPPYIVHADISGIYGERYPIDVVPVSHRYPQTDIVHMPDSAGRVKVR